MTRISVVIPSFRGAWRVERLLESVELHDPEVQRKVDWLVVEDPSDDEATAHYRRIVGKFPGVRYFKLAKWSNMHGAAKSAFELAKHIFDPDWIIYLGDDVLVTPFALSNLIHFLSNNELKTVGLVQIPYWNAHDLSVDGYDGKGNSEFRPAPGFELLVSKTEMYSRDPSWLATVPRNPHWERDGRALPYVNVNGVGFACRTSHYFEVGGFAEGTWCLDESISVRTWLRSGLSIVALPGPCFVHYFAGATESGPPAHDMHTAERWAVAMGMSKQEAGELSYARMHERQDAVNQEMVSANYFRNPEPVRG